MKYVVAMHRGLALLFCAAFAAALSAQTAAPFNDSIRLADLKADLFFLAGDGFRAGWWARSRTRWPPNSSAPASSARA
jgi:hypothetical protein